MDKKTAYIHSAALVSSAFVERLNSIRYGIRALSALKDDPHCYDSAEGGGEEYVKALSLCKDILNDRLNEEFDSVLSLFRECDSAKWTELWAKLCESPATEIKPMKF